MGQVAVAGATFAQVDLLVDFQAEPVQGVPQLGVVLALGRVQAAEDHRLRLAVAGQRLGDDRAPTGTDQRTRGKREKKTQES